MPARTQRLRDPVHGLITFDKDNPIDELAWRLIDTPEFQRLRRIKQLGLSDFVFPGATHSRFAHSIGVFHVARGLIRIIEREVGKDFDSNRAVAAVIAALLHDLGHGPFSHTFEGVQKSRDMARKHEKWTAEIIRNPEGSIQGLLNGFADDHSFCENVASLIEADDPADIYHAVVSSSFDADRLDYLRRDRLMTGTGAGAIDFDWLMEHVRVREIAIDAPDLEEGRVKVPTFCFDAKALPAAEQFLLARYTLHQQVYLHKTTCCVEQMIATLLRAAANHAQDSSTAPAHTGLAVDHPLLRFFARDGATLANFLALDDFVLMGAVERMTTAGDREIAELAQRLRARRLYKTLDLRDFGHDEGRQRKEARRIDRDFIEGLRNGTVIKDEGAAISIYTQIGGDDEKTHKKLHILDANVPREITEMSPLVSTLKEKLQFTRYYFANEADRAAARQPRRKP